MSLFRGLVLYTYSNAIRMWTLGGNRKAMPSPSWNWASPLKKYQVSLPPPSPAPLLWKWTKFWSFLYQVSDELFFFLLLINHHIKDIFSRFLTKNRFLFSFYFVKDNIISTPPPPIAPKNRVKFTFALSCPKMRWENKLQSWLWCNIKNCFFFALL